MKPLTFIGIVITLIIALVGASVLFFALRPPAVEKAPAPVGQYPGGYQNTVPVTGGGTSTSTPGPVSGSNGGGNNFVVPTKSGGQVATRDFLKDETVGKDEYNSGVYYLAGSDPSEPNYSITYIESDSSFTISIFSEPIGEQRQLAELKLLGQLGISEPEACHLRYAVLVPASVNPLYAGKDLGFSFCPGATPL